MAPTASRVGLGGAIGLALALAAVALVVGGGSGASPAYATVFHNSGTQRTVTITLREEQDIPPAQRASQGRAHTHPSRAGRAWMSRPRARGFRWPGRPGAAKTLLAIPQYINGRPLHIVSETIEVNTIAGRTLVIAGLAQRPLQRRRGYRRTGAVVRRESALRFNVTSSS